MAAKVFISYRRDDSAGYAGRVRDRLERELGRDLLFMDVDAIPLGTRRDIPVIPILLDGARIPKADQLPEELKELASRNGMDIRHASFHDDMNRLIRGLKGQVDQAGTADGVYLARGDASEFLTKTHVAQGHLSHVQGTDGLWGFLRDKRHQQVLGWLGGGLVVLATGLWAAFIHFFPPVKEAKSPEATPASVQANCGGIAIGRDVTGSTITAGTTTNSDCAK
jgi:hypothetical protein